MNILINKRILIISPEPWEHNFVSKHYYAINLGRAGNSVFFLNPPSRKHECGVTPYPNLSVINYQASFRGLNMLPPFLGHYLSLFDIRNIIDLAGGRFDVVWTFDPYRFQKLQKFNAPLNIYFAADFHAARKLESRVAGGAQVVLFPSHLLMDAIRTRTRRFFINHAVSDHFFAPQRIVSLPGRNYVKIGYVGNLSSKYLDYSLLQEVVSLNPHCDFIFAGNSIGHKMETVKRFENVHFAGPLSHQEVPRFLSSCHVLLLCYDTVKYQVEASNSHKIMEYLASGTPIVSTRIHEYLTKSELICMPELNSGLPALLKSLVENLPKYNSKAFRQRRIMFAKEHTYERQLDRIDNILGETSAIKNFG